MSQSKVKIGCKYGNLTVISRCGTANDRQALYECKCDCGNKCIVRGRSLTDGRTKSCGCYKAKHRSWNTLTYKSWISAHQRCKNPHNHNYPYYGGRGIVVCDRWSGYDGFINFLSDMGERPSKEYTLDRIDVNGNYEPSNCRWATKIEQGNNRRNNHILIDNGIEITASQFARKHGLTQSQVFYGIRLNLSCAEILIKYNINQ